MKLLRGELRRITFNVDRVQEHILSAPPEKNKKIINCIT